MGRVDPQKHEEFLAMMRDYNIINPMIPFKDSFYLSSNINNMVNIYEPSKDIWMINSKVDNKGCSLYQKVVDKYFYRGINPELFTGNVLKVMCPCLESVPSADGSNRALKYAYNFSLMALLSQKSAFVDKEKMFDGVLQLDELALADKVKKEIVELRNMHGDVLNNGINSPYYDAINTRFKQTGLMMNNSLLQKNKDMFSNIVTIIRNIKINITENNLIPEKEFMDCFDIDKFYLMYCKCVVDFVNYFDQMSKNADGKGYVHNCFACLGQYLYLIDECFKDTDYNPMIKYFDYKENKFKFYTIRDLRKEYEKIEREHKDNLQRVEFSAEQAKKIGVVHNIDGITNLLKVTSEKDADIIKTGWDILAPGETGSKVSSKSSGTVGSKAPAKVVETEDIIFRKMVFEKTNYAAKIVGKDRFAGYIGYMYYNGIVVFEKFYNDDKCTKPAQSNATYVMKIDNFTKFAKMSKSEIIEFIKNTQTDEIDRLYHSKNWENRLPRVVSGVEYSQEAQMIIDTLIESNKKNNKTL